MTQTRGERAFGAKFGRVEAVADGVAQFHGFCNVGFVYGGGAALVVDTSNRRAGPRAAEALRQTSDEPIATIVYTHGHLDHIVDEWNRGTKRDKHGIKRDRAVDGRAHAGSN